MRVGENNHQHDDVAHHSHQEDDQVAQVHQGLDNREEDVSLVLVTYWSRSGDIFLNLLLGCYCQFRIIHLSHHNLVIFL